MLALVFKLDAIASIGSAVAPVRRNRGPDRFPDCKMRCGRRPCRKVTLGGVMTRYLPPGRLMAG